MKKSFTRKLLDVISPFDRIKIQPYRGYGNQDRFFLKGRVLEDEGIFQSERDGRVRNLINSLKRFESDEVPAADVDLTMENKSISAVTDREGYFKFEQPWDFSSTRDRTEWHPADLRLTKLKNQTEEIKATAEILVPSANSDFGLITDIDDTVLQTHVTSKWRWKMLYATFFQNSHQRLPMEGAAELLQKLVKGGNGRRENPVFYVSHSPWNLYDLIEEFMKTQKLPKGPLLLRDYGVKPSGNFTDHKIKSISHILQMYPDKPFILLGDSAERDADIYLEAAKRNRGRIKTIYIRLVKDNDNARRVAHLLARQKETPARLVETSDQILEHARGQGLVV